MSRGKSVRMCPGSSARMCPESSARMSPASNARTYPGSNVRMSLSSSAAMSLGSSVRQCQGRSVRLDRQLTEAKPIAILRFLMELEPRKHSKLFSSQISLEYLCIRAIVILPLTIATDFTIFIFSMLLKTANFKLSRSLE